MTTKNLFTWPRLLCILVTVGLLWFAFRGVQLTAVWEVMRQSNPWYFLAALLTYEVALVLAAFVWHVALHVVGCGSHALATNRFALIGHFFFVALFGAVGCDIAKSGVYARWFRFGLPEVLAAAPLERSIRAVGAIVLGVIVLIVGAFSGGMAALSRLRLNISPMWIWAGIGAVAVLVILLRYSRRNRSGFLARLVSALRTGTLRILHDHELASVGIVAAVFAQAAASAVFALALAGISDMDFPWLRMAWTFPTIILFSALPFTVAGTGVREVAAVILLKIYGVPPVLAVAASLLTLVQKVILAAIGAALWWREERLQKRASGRRAIERISAVVPALNESAMLARTLRALKAVPEICEIIVVDGGSCDDTVSIAERSGCEVIQTERGRGRQMRLGAQRATGDAILFVHADTIVPAKAGRALLSCLRDATVVGGAFWKRYQRTTLPLLGARVKCLLRLAFSRRVLGDQAMFVRRDVLEAIGGVPGLPLMEDVELCRAMRRHGRVALADATVLASERRFRDLGYLHTFWVTWKVSLLHRFGRPPTELAAIYRPHSVKEPKTEPGEGEAAVASSPSGSITG